MMDPTKPDRSFLQWGLVTRHPSTPTFVSFMGKAVVAQTRQEVRDLNDLAFGGRHKVVRVRLTIQREV